MQVKKQQLKPDMEQQIGKIGKGVHQGCILSPCYLTYMKSISCKVLDESQAGIKVAGRNINNLRYVGNTTLMAESKGAS